MAFYLNLDLDFFEHPKTRRLVGLLGKGAELVALRLWCYAGKFHSADGRFTGYDEQEIEAVIRWWGDKGAVLPAMEKVGFMAKDETGWFLRNWNEHQGHIEALKQNGRDRANARWGKVAGNKLTPRNADGNADGNASGNADGNAEGNAAGNAPTNQPTNQPANCPKSNRGGGGEVAKLAKGAGEPKGEPGRFPVPVFDPLPSPLYKSTADEMVKAVQEQIAFIKAKAAKVPQMGTTPEGTKVKMGTTLETEAQAAIEQWEKRLRDIRKGLAG